MQKASQAYFQTQLTTVGQGELLLLLYDGALKFLAQAREKIIAKDYAAKGILISKALDIINELDGSLNENAGGDLARNLHQLYFMCSAKLLEANMRMDPALLDISINILTGLRSAYAQIINTPEAKAAGAQIAAKQSPTGASVQRAAPLPGSGISAPGAGLGRAAGNAAYKSVGNLGGLPGMGATPTFGGSSVPGMGTQAPTAQPPAPSAARPAVQPASPPPVAQAGFSAPTAPVTTATTAAAMPPVTPAAPTAPTAPPLDLTPRRSAASALYGKMAQR